MDDRWRQIAEALRRELEELCAENGRLRRELEAAYRRIAELQRAAARQAAPFRRAESRRIRPEQQKRPGRNGGQSPVLLSKYR
jgi:Tfp pilus assembly protein PilN